MSPPAGLKRFLHWLSYNTKVGRSLVIPLFLPFREVFHTPVLLCATSSLCSWPMDDNSCQKGTAADGHALHSKMQPACSFEFEDVDCKSRSLRVHTDAQGASAADVEDLLLSGDDDAVSPLPAIKETGELMAKLVLMYVVLEVAAGLLKGHSPIQHLVLAAVHLRMVFQAMLAPLSMMCSGFVLALVQYSLLLKKQQQRRTAGTAQAAAATVEGKSKAE